MPSKKPPSPSPSSTPAVLSVRSSPPRTRVMQVVLVWARLLIADRSPLDFAGPGIALDRARGATSAASSRRNAGLHTSQQSRLARRNARGYAGLPTRHSLPLAHRQPIEKL